MIQRGGLIAIGMLADARRRAIGPLIRRPITPGTVAYTDEYDIDGRLPQWGYAHHDSLVNNAGIFFTKPFTDYTAEDFRSLVLTNLEGFLYIIQLSIKQMLEQFSIARQTGGSIVTIKAALARNPILGVPAAVPRA